MTNKTWLDEKCPKCGYSLQRITGPAARVECSNYECDYHKYAPAGCSCSPYAWNPQLSRDTCAVHGRKDA